MTATAVQGAISLRWVLSLVTYLSLNLRFHLFLSLTDPLSSLKSVGSISFNIGFEVQLQQFKNLIKRLHASLINSSGPLTSKRRFRLFHWTHLFQYQMLIRLSQQPLLVDCDYNIQNTSSFVNMFLAISNI